MGAGDRPSQLAWLKRDIGVYRDLVAGKPELLGRLGDLTDPVRHNFYNVVADLYWISIHHALGVVSLLEEELRTPAVVVQRALYETAVSLKYLVTRPDPNGEALTYRAYSFLKELEFFAGDSALVADRERVLAIVPEEAVAEARKRIGKRQSWSGQNMKVMAERAGFTGYELYGWLSEEGHSRVIGYHARLEKTGEDKGVVRLGRPLEQAEVENMANFARRMLSFSFMAFWSAFEGGPVDLKTSDPHAWVVNTGGAV